MNITQYGELDGDYEITEANRRESIKDILNLGFTAHLESSSVPHLPTDRASAIR